MPGTVTKAVKYSFNAYKKGYPVSSSFRDLNPGTYPEAGDAIRDASLG